jgi:Uma2 family endonuclease
MSPVTLFHDQIIFYLRQLITAYFAFRPIGKVIAAPFVMRLDSVPSRREPDLQVILHTNPGTLTDTAMIGAADICIEVVSPESVARDYGEKMVEYEQGGVQEYWLIDPRRRAAIFYRLTERAEGGRLYQAGALDDGDRYTTPLLPRFALPVPTLWSDPLPDRLNALWRYHRV